jgi:hypothetical protein
MRFQKYLTETSTLSITAKMEDKDKEQFAKDCKFFFSHKEYKNYPMYRGVPKAKGQWLKKTSRLDDREPMTTREYLHNKWNHFFEKKFGWKVRNGVMATGDEELAGDYAGSNREPYYFFPCGNYEFCWSWKVNDLYIAHGSIDYKPFKKPQGAAMAPRDVEETDKEIQYVVDEYTDKNLVEAIKSEHEISFKCKEYYLIDISCSWENIFDEISAILK